MSATGVEYSWSQADGPDYENLIDKIETWMADLNREHLNSGYYRVVWETETKDPSTKYTITGFGEDYGGEPTIFIEGGRGGEYQIIPKPSGPPILQYHHPSGKYSQFWDERLVRMAVIGPEFEPYEQEGGLWQRIF